MTAGHDARRRELGALFRRARRKLKNVVTLVQKKGLRDIVSRRVIAPIYQAAASTQSSLPFAPYLAPRRRGSESWRIATLVDPGLELCVGFDAQLLALGDPLEASALGSFAPNLVLVTSHALFRGESGPEQVFLDPWLGACRDLAVPSVLWIDDESQGHDRLLRLARSFDWVFVTAPEAADPYRMALGHERVGVLPPAIQPVLHNPMDRPLEQRSLCWLGSLAESERFPASDAFRALLAAAENLGLDVFEPLPPGAAADARRVSSGAFEVWRGHLDYERVLSAYRAYRVFLVDDRAGPLAMRAALEMTACGARPVAATNESESPLVPEGFTRVSEADDPKQVLEQLSSDDVKQSVALHRAYREVMEEHTYLRRLETIRQRLGMAGTTAEPPLVSVLAASNRPERLGNILDNFARQAHPRCELVLLLNSDAYDLGAVRERVGSRGAVKIFQLDETLTLADCLNHGVDHASGSWIAKFDDDDFYGAKYLTDLLTCTSFTDADLLGKRAYHVYFESSDSTALRFAAHRHRHVEFVHGATLLVRRAVFDHLRFTPVQRGTDTLFQRACRERGLSIYSSDPYNFVHVRHGASAAHTWAISDRELLDECSFVRGGLSLDEIMV